MSRTNEDFRIQFSMGLLWICGTRTVAIEEHYFRWFSKHLLE